MCPIRETGRKARNDKKSTGTSRAKRQGNAKAPPDTGEGIHGYGDHPYRAGGSPSGADLWKVGLTGDRQCCGLGSADELGRFADGRKLDAIARWDNDISRQAGSYVAAGQGDRLGTV